MSGGGADWRRAWLLAILFAFAVTLAGLGSCELFSGDETRVAGIAAEMAVEGDCVLPQLNGQPFLEYPPLYYILTAGSFHLFGFCAFAAKFVSALAAALAGIAVFAFARDLNLSPTGALWAEFFYLTCGQIVVNTRKCMVDMLLGFFVLLAIFAFYRMRRATRRKRAAAAWLLCAAAMTGGFYTKGLLGIVLPVAVIGAWQLACDMVNRRFFSWKRYFQLAGAMAVALGCGALWYVAVFQRIGQGGLTTAFLVNNFGRFSGTQGDHVKPLWFYFARLGEFFQPWLFLFLAALWLRFRRAFCERDEKILLLLSFSLVPFLLLSCAAAKRSVYLLPIFSGWALLAAVGIPLYPEKLLSRFRRVFPRPLTAFAWLFAVTALLIGSLEFLYGVRHEKEWSVKPMYRYVAAQEAKGYRAVLLTTIERAPGAAWYYRRRPIATEEFRADGKIPPRTIWIMRFRESPPPSGWKPWGDDFYTLTSGDQM